MAKPLALAGIIFAIIATLTIVIIVIIIVVSRLRASAKEDEKPSLEDDESLAGILCSSNDQCTSGACNTTLGVCVECLDDNQCGNTLPYCKTENNVCVECLETSDCDSPETCLNNECCQDTPPEITGITETLNSNRLLSIAYNIYQPRLKSTVSLVIEDPVTGFVLGKPGCVASTTAECIDTPGCTKPCFEFPGVSPTLDITEANAGIKFYGGFQYRFRIQVTYKCGDNNVKITDMSAPFLHVMAVCPDTPLISPLGTGIRTIVTRDGSTFPDGSVISGIAYTKTVFIVLNIPNGGPNFSVTILANDTPNLHPSLALLEFGGQTEDGFDEIICEPPPTPFVPPITGGPAIPYKIVRLPPVSPSIVTYGQPYYFRVYRNGDIGECDGRMTGGEVSFTFNTTYPC